MAGELTTTQQDSKNIQQSRAKDTISVLLSQDQIKKRFEQVLGKKAPGFMSSVISAVNSNDQLKKADPMSVVASAAVAASLDLPINPSLGFAHIVPYKKDGVPIAQFQMGWRGFVQLGMRTGQYKTINVSPVHEGELVSNNPFTGEMEFSADSRISDKIIGYVAYFKLLNGFEKYLYMTATETKAHGKRYSKTFTRDTSKWQTDFDAMSMKTVLKMLMSKYGILSIEMQTAIQADQAVVKDNGEYEYPDNPDAIIEGEEVKQITNGNEALKAKLKGKQEENIVDAVIDESSDLAPGECPDSPGNIYSKAHCDACEKRQGCPVWS